MRVAGINTYEVQDSEQADVVGFIDADTATAARIKWRIQAERINQSYGGQKMSTDQTNLDFIKI